MKSAARACSWSAKLGADCSMSADEFSRLLAQHMEPVAKHRGHGLVNRVGQRHGRLTVIGMTRTAAGKIRWVCTCDCGGVASATGNNLKYGNTRSCGCLKAETNSRRNKERAAHGEADITVEYKTWTSLRDRCLNPNDRSYPAYGGRGITVCDRWLNGADGVHPFLCFLVDMGRRPSADHSIDRRENDGPYEPSNCRWATRSEQQKNKRPLSRARS